MTGQIQSIFNDYLSHFSHLFSNCGSNDAVKKHHFRFLRFSTRKYGYLLVCSIFGIFVISIFSTFSLCNFGLYRQEKSLYANVLLLRGNFLYDFVLFQRRKLLLRHICLLVFNCWLGRKYRIL